MQFYWNVSEVSGKVKKPAGVFFFWVCQINVSISERVVARCDAVSPVTALLQGSAGQSEHFVRQITRNSPPFLFFLNIWAPSVCDEELKHILLCEVSFKMFRL